MHLNSNKFLAARPEEADFEKSNFKMTLDDYSSESTLFKIIPAYKY
jgi:inositol 1,4,5-triphosphate receptor type 1